MTHVTPQSTQLFWGSIVSWPIDCSCLMANDLWSRSTLTSMTFHDSSKHETPNPVQMPPEYTGPKGWSFYPGVILTFPTSSNHLQPRPLQGTVPRLETVAPWSSSRRHISTSPAMAASDKGDAPARSKWFTSALLRIISTANLAM